MAVNGPATSQQIGFEKLKRAANIDVTYVPFPGGGPATNALLGEHVTSLFVNYPSAAEQFKAGKLRVLAVASRARIESLPELPTIIESGLPSFEEEDVWFGTAAIGTPEIKSKLAVQELYPVGLCGAEFGAYLRKQYDIYGRIIRDANIKAE